MFGTSSQDWVRVHAGLPLRTAKLLALGTLRVQVVAELRLVLGGQSHTSCAHSELKGSSGEEAGTGARQAQQVGPSTAVPAPVGSGAAVWEAWGSALTVLPRWGSAPAWSRRWDSAWATEGGRFLGRQLLAAAAVTWTDAAASLGAQETSGRSRGWRRSHFGCWLGWSSSAARAACLPSSSAG